jgi:hypothetical protein
MKREGRFKLGAASLLMAAPLIAACSSGGSSDSVACTQARQADMAAEQALKKEMAVDPGSDAATSAAIKRGETQTKAESICPDYRPPS